MKTTKNCFDTGGGGISTGLRIVKKIWRSGDFTPKEKEEPIIIEESDLEHSVAVFEEMKRCGIAVPVVRAHSMEPDDTLGYVKEMWTAGGYLFAALEAFTEEEAETIRRNGVSVFMPETYETSNHHFERPIVHVASTPYPYMEGLDVMASTFTPEAPEKEKKKMDEMTKSFVALIAMSLGIDVPEDNILPSNEAALAWATAILQKPASPDTKAPEPKEDAAMNETEIPGALDQSDNPLKENEFEGECAPGDGKECEKKKEESQMFASLMTSYARRTRLEKLNSLVEKGQLSPATASMYATQICHSKMSAGDIVRTEAMFSAIVAGAEQQTKRNILGSASGAQSNTAASRNPFAEATAKQYPKKGNNK